MILEAITIKKATFSIKQDQQPFESLTERAGECLRELLVDPDHPYQDWDAEMLEYSSLMRHMLVLLGTPGIVVKLPSYASKKAAERLARLIDFFEILNDNSETILPWLDLVHSDFISTGDTDEWIDRTIAYYDFSKRYDHPHALHYFYSHEAEHLKKQELAFTAIREAMDQAGNARLRT